MGLTEQWLDDLYSDTRENEWEEFKNTYAELIDYCSFQYPDDESIVNLLPERCRLIGGWSYTENSFHCELTFCYNTTTAHQRWLCLQQYTPNPELSIPVINEVLFIKDPMSVVELRCNGKVIGLFAMTASVMKYDEASDSASSRCIYINLDGVFIINLFQGQGHGTKWAKRIGKWMIDLIETFNKANSQLDVDAFFIGGNILSESGGRFTDHFTAPLSAWAKTRNIEYFTDWEN